MTDTNSNDTRLHATRLLTYNHQGQRRVKVSKVRDWSWPINVALLILI